MRAAGAESAAPRKPMFDEIVGMEERLVAGGYEQGARMPSPRAGSGPIAALGAFRSMRAGLVQGQQRGRAAGCELGRQKGWEMGVEVGRCRGRVEALLRIYERHPDRCSERCAES